MTPIYSQYQNVNKILETNVLSESCKILIINIGEKELEESLTTKCYQC